MEKGPSDLADDWAYENSDTIHTSRHAPEFGFDGNDIERYKQAAKNFIVTKTKGNMLFQKANGSTYKYNPKTKEFAIYTRDGKTVTYFRTSLRYFLNEYRKGNAEWLYKGDE